MSGVSRAATGAAAAGKRSAPPPYRLWDDSEQLVTAAVSEARVVVKPYHADIRLAAHGLADPSDAIGAKATTQFNGNTAMRNEINGNTTGFGV